MAPYTKEYVIDVKNVDKRIRAYKRLLFESLLCSIGSVDDYDKCMNHYRKLKERMLNKFPDRKDEIESYDDFFITESDKLLKAVKAMEKFKEKNK